MAKEDKTYKITVDGIERIVETDTLTYEDVVAFVKDNYHPDTIFSVTYSKAKDPKEGELSPGQSVQIKNNTEFDVLDTGRS